MKLCVSQTTRADRIERVISDETVVVVSSPVMLRRKKKGAAPILKGLISLQQYPIDLYQDFIKIENLYVDSDVHDYALIEGDYKEWQRRVNLRNKIQSAKAYWWVYESNRTVKEDSFEYLFNTHDPEHFSGNLVEQFKREYAPAKQWGILKYGDVLPILRRNKIINKLLDELIVVKLSE